MKTSKAVLRQGWSNSISKEMEGSKYWSSTVSVTYMVKVNDCILASAKFVDSMLMSYWPAAGSGEYGAGDGSEDHTGSVVSA